MERDKKLSLQEAFAVVEVTIDLGLALIADECKLPVRHNGSDASEKAVFKIFRACNRSRRQLLQWLLEHKKEIVIVIDGKQPLRQRFSQR